MVKSPQDAPRKRQRRKDSLPHFKTGSPITVRALALWEQTLAATLAQAHPFRFTASMTGNKADDKEGVCSGGINMRHTSSRYLKRSQLHLLWLQCPWTDIEASNVDKICS